MARKDDQEELEVSGPMGIKGKLKGPLGQVLILLLIVVLAFGLYKHEVDTKERQGVTVQEVKSIKADVEKKFDEVVYVLTLKQEDREKLKLDMPESLRRKRGHNQ